MTGGLNSDRRGGGLTYDQRTETYSLQHDWHGDRSVSSAVVWMVAEIEGVDPIELNPLHDCVDPDALDRLLAPTRGGTRRTGAHVSFIYSGYHVTVYGDGEIAVSHLRD
ncbi:HalOD1 output domain-containing protein [Halegenticoccus soli]|uniref:HalOD1 output domain-containing protein n=1 Tax=Halegenticoccus soli TaxID=1985678 RepID=UPI001304322B|nr:HalOD1 output domain-containing protein [Halegenticoccus soli]